MNKTTTKIKKRLAWIGAGLKNALSPTKFARTVLYHSCWYTMSRRKFEGLHLGPGNTMITKFLSIDASWFIEADVTAKIMPLKIADNSTRAIYASHVFEHTDRTKAFDIIREWRRVLEPGGTLYISVPDLEKLFKIYLENIARYDDDNARATADKACRIVYGGQINKYDYHYYGYSFATMQYLLLRVGFKHVRLFDPCAEKLISKNSDSSFASISLNLKAIK